MAFAPVALGVGSLLLGGYAAYQQHQAGRFAVAENRLAAKQEQVAAGQEAIERRRALIRALAARNAAAGAAGIETSGSLEAMTRADIRDAQNDLLLLDADALARQRARRLRSRNLQMQANASAAGSLLDSIGRAYDVLGGRERDKKHGKNS